MKLISSFFCLFGNRDISNLDIDVLGILIPMDTGKEIIQALAISLRLALANDLMEVHTKVKLDQHISS